MEVNIEFLNSEFVVILYTETFIGYKKIAKSVYSKDQVTVLNDQAIEHQKI